MTFMERNSKFINIIVLIVCVLSFWGCDSYHSRAKVIAELSSLYSENIEEFNNIHDFFLGDSLAKSLVVGYENNEFRSEDNKIMINIANNPIIIDSIKQMKDNSDIYQILTFMERKKIRQISSNGKEGWISIRTKYQNNISLNLTCYNFWYRSDFNPDDEYIKQEVENIKNTQTKNWIYILGNGWYIKGVKCF